LSISANKLAVNSSLGNRMDGKFLWLQTEPGKKILRTCAVTCKPKQWLLKLKTLQF